VDKVSFPQLLKLIDTRNLGQNRYLFRDLMICGRLQLLTVADMYGLFVVWNAWSVGEEKFCLTKKFTYD